jgi:N-acetyl-beta-hexosaminidase
MAYFPVNTVEAMRTKGPRPGAVALLAVLRERAGDHAGRDKAVDGIYNKRRIRGGLGWSVHAGGRAIDLGVKDTPLGKQLGDFLTVVLMQKATALGIQMIIWHGKAYYPDGRVKNLTRKTDKTLDHRDHLHIEMTPHAADNVTLEWVNGVLG